jgi:hypothetical protein
VTSALVPTASLVLGAKGFAAVVWGTVSLVVLVLAYLLYVLARDAGLVD